MFLRKFIIMSKQSSKDVKGHARLEVRGAKGRMSFSLEGVQFRDDVIYELLSLTNEKSGFKQVILGKVDVNNNGKGRLELAFNPNEVGQSKVPISDLNILLLSEKSTLQNEDKVILGGYIHQDDNSISKSLKHIKELQKVKKVENKVEIKEEYIEKIDNEIENEKEIEDSTNLKDIESTKEIDKIEKIKEKSIKIEQKPDFKSSVNSRTNIFKNVNQDREEVSEVKEFSNKQENEEIIAKETLEKELHSKDYNDHVASYTLDLLKFFKEIKPFKVESKSQRWWQIDYDETNSKLGFLPYYSYISSSPYRSNIKENYATCQSQIRRYKKYLFGVAEDDGKITHYIYGIPGKRIKSEHPYGGSTGFVTWLEDKDVEGEGYWLSYINACTGNVVRPI